MDSSRLFLGLAFPAPDIVKVSKKDVSVLIGVAAKYLVELIIEHAYFGGGGSWSS